MELIDTIKQRPVLVIGGGIALVLLAVAMRGGGGGGGDVIGASLQSQAISSDLQKASMGAHVAALGINADVLKARNQSAAEMYAAVTAADVARNQANIGGQVGIISSFLQSQDFNAALRAQQSISLREIDAGERVALAGYAADMESFRYATDSNERLTSQYLANSFSTSNDELRYYYAHLPQVLANQQETMWANTGTVRHAITSNTTTANKLISEQASAAKRSDYLNFAGNMADIFASFF